MTLEECEAQIATLPARWRDFLGALQPDRLPKAVVYTNSKGEPWTNTVQDILQHVVMHSAYHRAQIATEVRAAGHLPAHTDFIHAARNGIIG
ncbi:MAG TPA: DinB family protein [Longimicrobiaceae bacterium]|nr:DinB family protein [Longimicrobiaceae bacterium]